jgi:hypothetical protein
MDATSYHDIESSLRQFYLDDPHPWLIGFSGTKPVPHPEAVWLLKCQPNRIQF